MISLTGASLLVQTAQVSDLARGLSQQLRPSRAARSIHDPGQTVLDLAVAMALDGDCLADAAVRHRSPEKNTDVRFSRLGGAGLLGWVSADKRGLICAYDSSRGARRSWKFFRDSYSTRVS